MTGTFLNLNGIQNIQGRVCFFYRHYRDENKSSLSWLTLQNLPEENVSEQKYIHLWSKSILEQDMSTKPLHAATLKARHATDSPCCCLDEERPISISEVTGSLSLNNNPVLHFNLMHSSRSKINPLSFSTLRNDTPRQRTILRHSLSEVITRKKCWYLVYYITS